MLRLGQERIELNSHLIENISAQCRHYQDFYGCQIAIKFSIGDLNDFGQSAKAQALNLARPFRAQLMSARRSELLFLRGLPFLPIFISGRSYSFYWQRSTETLRKQE
jgi:hypothetical protein